MSAIHPTTNAIFQWAKRAARADRRDRLTLPDLLCGLLAVHRQGALDAPLRRLVVTPDEREGTWPEDILGLYERASAVPEDVGREKWAFDDAIAAVVKRAYHADPAMGPMAFSNALDASTNHLPYRLSRTDSQAAKGEARPADRSHETGTGAGTKSPAVRLERLLDQAAALTAALRTRVIGQDAAVEMLSDAFFRASLRGSVGGLRGLISFLGPPGVGKTLLAESFAGALSTATGEPFAYRRFDMGSFAGPQNFEQLLGTEAFYKGSRPGTLTGFVHEHPRAVVLFDEIEKAHENTLQALLAPLDRGEVTDKALDKPVSLHDVWCIVTTNLGTEFFGSTNEAGILWSTGTTPARAFDILRAARPRQSRGVEGAQAALPPEFVSRLAKGGAVWFQPLEPRHYLDLIDQHLRAFGASASPPLPAIEVEADARLLFLLSLLPGLDARRAVAAAQQWATTLVRESFEACRQELLQAAPAGYRIKVSLGDDARAFLDARLQPAEPTRLLIVDDDPWLPDVVREGCAEFGLDIAHVSPSGDVLDDVHRHRPDLVLLDLSLLEDADSPRVDAALRVLAEVRHAVPALPVYVFSENPHRRAAFDAVVERVLRHGGARGFLPWHRDSSNPVLVDDFTTRLGDVLRERQRSALIRQHLRSRTEVRFDTRYQWHEGRGEIVAELIHPAASVVAEADDQAARIGFAGIPRERFSDVAGLERAKRRLEAVSRWLRQPGVLAAYGVSLPRGFLLAGPPGTGKTLLARALAGETGLPFFALAAGELLSKWYGESEERVRELFARARRYAPAIVFVDEIDAIATARHDVSDGATGRVLTQLLAEMDGFRHEDRPVFVLAATNRADALDPAIRRPGRFDETIPIDLPRAAARADFLTKAFARLRVAASPDVGWLVRITSGFTPAQLDRVVRESAYLSAAEGAGEITAAQIEQAVRLVRFGARQEDLLIHPGARARTAYHEAGHAVAHLALLPERPVDYLSIIPTEGGTLGVLATEADEAAADFTREDLERRLTVMLAGRAGERLAPASPGVITSGASSDLAQATRLAHAAVTRWGFDEEFGQVSIEGLAGSAAAAAEARSARLVRKWVEAASVRADALVAERRPALTALADALLAEESLDGEEVAAVWKAAGQRDLAQQAAHRRLEP